MKQIPCSYHACGERRVHYEHPDVPRGPQTVEVLDDFIGKAYCSIECAAYDGHFSKDKTKQIFVFGSNLAGRHGKGAALTARQQHGAVYGQGYGLQGQSFAIPTRDSNLKTLPLSVIQSYVNMFIGFAEANPDLVFNVTRIGCGLAGYKDSDIAPMFKDAPNNCNLPDGWRLS